MNTYTPEGLGQRLGQFLIQRINSSSLIASDTANQQREFELAIECGGVIGNLELFTLLKTFFKEQGLTGPGLMGPGPIFVLFDPSGKELNLNATNFTDPPGLKRLYLTWS